MRITLDEIDKKLIASTESGLPLNLRPFEKLAQDLNLPVEIVKDRMQKFLDIGIIRRIAAVPNHYKMGYSANGMTVWDIEDEHITELGKKVGALDFVTHCYQRPRHRPLWPYNLFAMVHGKSKTEVEEKKQIIEKLLGEHCRSSQILYSKRILKKTGFRTQNKINKTQSKNSQSQVIDQPNVYDQKEKQGGIQNV
jgi:DNA-binding Lrp family transcriptional regulator